MDGIPSVLYLDELEKCFGFKKHYTDIYVRLTGSYRETRLSDRHRQSLIGQSMDVRMMEALIKFLTFIFKTTNDKTNK